MSFRVWAPAQDTVELLYGQEDAVSMSREDDGYFACFIDGVRAGDRYRFQLGTGGEPAADPASRFQPDGPDGASQIIDPAHYAWRDAEWKGLDPKGQVLYELHIGTFTPEGDWAAAARKLTLLKEIGITCLEIMPVNEFGGAFGWGYDGTHPFAPYRFYGRPDDLRAFVDEAHGLGIGVILDVVYNHFGTGERLAEFSPAYFTERYRNDWGASINFDGPDSGPVRDFIVANAVHWIEEYHFDGLRLDATQALYDAGDEHIMTRIARETRAVAGQHALLLIGENEPQNPRLVRPPDRGGYGLDALWNDDFHHSAMVALTGRREAYYHDHRGAAQEFVASAKYGYLFQGQRYDWQDGARGQPCLDLKAWNFVHFLQNHDQIANSARGARIGQLAVPARIRALTTLLLLGPQTPMLFQGQEFGATAPFLYFADRQGMAADEVRAGRLAFLAQFPSLTDPAFGTVMPDPHDRGSFQRAKLDWRERERNAPLLALHRDLLALRRDARAFSEVAEGRVEGSCLSSTAFLLRRLMADPDDDRLLLINLGSDIERDSVADPLLAPPQGRQWKVIWSSEAFAYGGGGIRPLDLSGRWALSSDAAIVLAPSAAGERERSDLPAWQSAISRIPSSITSEGRLLVRPGQGANARGDDGVDRIVDDEIEIRPAIDGEA